MGGGYEGYIPDNERGYPGSCVRAWYNSKRTSSGTFPVIDITPAYIAVLYRKGSSGFKPFHSIQRAWQNWEGNIILACTTDEPEIILQRCTAEEAAAILDRVPASWNRTNSDYDVYKIPLPQ